KGVLLTITALLLPTLIFGCPTTNGSSVAKSFVSNCNTAGVSPLVSSSRRSRKVSSEGEKAQERPLGRAFKGHRPPPHLASNTNIILPRPIACSGFGGKMRKSSTGSPAESRCSVEVFLAETDEADEGRPGARDTVVDSATVCPFSQCRPTATPWAHIFPH